MSAVTTERATKLLRTTADGYVKDIVRRISEVNSDDEFSYKVERAVVFGSYINHPERDRIGDLDVALKVVPKHTGDEQTEADERARRRCPSSYGYVDYLIWPREEVLRHIRNRRVYVSIHNIDVDAPAVFSEKWMELPVDGTDPGEVGA